MLVIVWNRVKTTLVEIKTLFDCEPTLRVKKVTYFHQRKGKYFQQIWALGCEDT